MAVQKGRKSASKRGMRRAHDSLGGPTLATESATGEEHRRHHVSPEGFYRGRQVVESRDDEDDED